MKPSARVIAYAAQRGTHLTYMGTFGYHPCLTARQRRRIRKNLSQMNYCVKDLDGNRRSKVVPF
jgi:hypothetical protein